MQKRIFSSAFFSAKDTLDCGQIFRYVPFNAGYTVFSQDKACYLETVGGETVVLSDNLEYFDEFFDVKRDLEKTYERAKSFGNAFLSAAAEKGKGIRLLRQDTEETLFSFIVSQNNNIPRIKGIIERLCDALGEEREFMGKTFKTFPKAEALASVGEDFYKSIGLGYRAAYMVETAKTITDGFDLRSLDSLPTSELKKKLLSLKGIGPKVADCVSLFGYYRYDSFPVDVWMEKVYREGFDGRLTDRKAVSDYFVKQFGGDAGYFQQYMFHYKRNEEAKQK